MKKISIISNLILSFSFILGLLFSYSPALAYDAGCTSTGPFSVTTGQLCYGSYNSPVVQPTLSVYTDPYNNSEFGSQEFVIGSTGPGIVALQQMLTTAGYSPGRIDGVYGYRTDRAYKLYQQSQYSVATYPTTTISYPYYPQPTPIYQPPAPPTYPQYNQPPSISGVSGPQTLAVGDLGTWTIQASDSNYYYGGYSNNNNLSYSVNWGDQQIQPYYLNNNSSQYSPQQSATFTHIYTQPGTFTPIFTVSNRATSKSAQTSLTVNVSATLYQNLSISSIMPTSGRVGTQVTIYGSGLSGATVNFGGYAVAPYYTYDNQVVFSVPANLNNCSYNQYCTQQYIPVNPGTYNIYASKGGMNSNSINFQVTY